MLMIMPIHGRLIILSVASMLPNPAAYLRRSSSFLCLKLTVLQGKQLRQTNLNGRCYSVCGKRSSGVKHLQYRETASTEEKRGID